MVGVKRGGAGKLRARYSSLLKLSIISPSYKMIEEEGRSVHSCREKTGLLIILLYVSSQDNFGSFGCC